MGISEESRMEYRQMGKSGLFVPAITFGTATFGGRGDFFQSWGASDIETATRLIELCIENGVTMFDSADNYSMGQAEEILGSALGGKRHEVIISTKTSCPLGTGPNDVGSSRGRIIAACEQSLRRLQTDYIDLYSMHISDLLTPPEETLRALEDLITSGKVRYIGVSNYAAWQVMKSIGIAESMRLNKYISYQGYYSLIGRDYEWELLPCVLDAGLGMMAWSPLGWGRLTGKIKRGQPASAGRIAAGGAEGGPPVSDDLMFRILDELEAISAEIDKPVAEIAIRWVLDRPSVSTVIIGARNEEQLVANLKASSWKLSPEQIRKLNLASQTVAPYPSWHLATLPSRNPVTRLWRDET